MIKNTKHERKIFMKDLILWSTDFDDMWESKEEFIECYGDMIVHNKGYQ